MTGHLTGKRFRRLGAIVAAGVIADVACGVQFRQHGGGTGQQRRATDDYQVKLGYFPNLTHASAIVGVEKGYFEDELAKDGASPQDVPVQQRQRHDRRAAQRLPRRHLHRSQPDHHRVRAVAGGVSVISGATSGGASLVVNSDIKAPEDLDRQDDRDARPRPTRRTSRSSTGSRTQGYKVEPRRHGRRHRHQPGQQPDGPGLRPAATSTVHGFPSRTPRCSSTRAATKLVDEADLWPDGQFVTTQLIVNNDFLKDHPDLVDDLLAGQIKANDYIAKQLRRGQAEVGELHRQADRKPDPGRACSTRRGRSSRSPTTRSPTRCSRASDHAVDVGLIDRSTTSPTSTTSTRSTSCSPTRASRKCPVRLSDDAYRHSRSARDGLTPPRRCRPGGTPRCRSGHPASAA